MRRWIAPLVAAMVVAGVAFGLLHRDPGWTASSPQALEEFQLGLEALSKIYYGEAQAHFEKALELDPGFVAAKLFLVQRIPTDPPRREALIREIRAADLDALTPRERFLVQRFLAAHDGHEAEATKITDAYLEKHPDDPYALELQAGRVFARGQWSEAEGEYKKLVEIVPNRVIAYNQMGYAQMAQGRFAEAEATFVKYRFIAPDQANPHDSLGELLALTGHYDRAEREFRNALAVKPDFWASYSHLLTLAVMRGDYDAAARVIAEAEGTPGFPASDIPRMRRSADLHRAVAERRWDDLARLSGQCTWKEDPDLEILAHDVLLSAGRPEAAKAIESSYAGVYRKGGGAGLPVAPGDAVALHLEGARLLSEGHAAEAVKDLQKTDDLLAYADLNRGTFKLFNRALLVEALRRAGQEARARTLMAEITAVNSSFARTVAEPMAQGGLPAS